MATYSIDNIVSAFLAEPQRATGLRWEHGRGREIWRSSQNPDGSESGRRDKIVIKQTTSGVPVIHHNGGTGESLNFWDYFKRAYSTNDTYEVITRLAECYGIQPDLSGFTQQQVENYRKRKANADLMNISAKYLTEAMTDGRSAETHKYLQSRELIASERLAAFSNEIKGELRQYLLESTGKTAQEIDAFITAAFPFHVCADEYRLVIPYYNSTTNKCTGFIGRLTSQQTTYIDRKTGEEVKKRKYWNSTTEIFIKGGYFTEYKHGLPVVIVEGYLDAERLKQAGLQERYNIFAFGTQTPTGTHETDAEHSQIATLQRCGAKHIIYVPDYEFEKDGTLRTAATQRTISAISPYIDGKQNGNGFISLCIAPLYNASPDDKTKQDADSFIRANGLARFEAVLSNAMPYYEWMLRQAVGSLTGRDLAAKATDIYCGIQSDIDKELLKRDLMRMQEPYLVTLHDCGFTARYLNGIDTKGAATSYRDAMAEAVGNLTKAVNEKASPDTIGTMLTRAQHIQNRSNDKGFNAQISATFEQIEQMQREMPEPVQTCWQMYNWSRKKKRDTETRKIEFYAKEVSFVCAPTSHGKTRFLIQTAVNFIKAHKKPILYLSLEQDAAKLHELAEKAYIGEKWAGIDNPTYNLRESIRGTDMPDPVYTATSGGRTELDLAQERKQYKANVFPFLKIVKSASDIDTICNNVRGYVEEMLEAGIDLDCVIIDHMQLIDASARAYSRTDEIKGICNALNDLAKDCGVPVIVASQFNRAASNNANKDTDGGFESIDTYNIAESSAIENIAADVYLVYNTNYLKENLTASGIDTEDDLIKKGMKRTARCYYLPDEKSMDDTRNKFTAKPDRMYVECLKGRYNGKGHYCLLPFRPETGYISNNAESSATYQKDINNNF